VIVDPLTLLVTVVAVFLVAFMKGAFGGGFAIAGIPLMALVMDPTMAGALLAPLFCVSDLSAMRYWRASTWSKPDLMLLIPGQLVGTVLGFVALRYANGSLVAIAIAVITLLFAGLWFAGGGRIVQRPRSRVKGVLAGVTAGVTSMVAHSGGPPVAMYLLPLGLPKSVYAGTTFMFFVVANVLKVGPWLALAPLTPQFWLLLAVSVPVTVLAVWTGWRVHERIDQLQLYRLCYALLVVVGAHLLWKGLAGYGLI
jgi:uncharacterized membrane protein YfcA